MLKTRFGRIGGALALALSASLIAVGCGDSKDDAATTTTAVEIPKGGTLVIGAEQEPDCVDWIASCAGSSWGSWMLKVQTIPQAFSVRDVSGTWTPQKTEVLAGDPEVEQVGGKQVITYKLGTKAVWSDGVAITAKDFVYTAETIRDGDDIYDKTGYDKIEKIEAKDDTTVVATLSTTYPDWRGLFSGGYGILPAHLLEGKDRSAIMKDGYDFSGGPWKLEKWDKGVSITLVPNDKYWGAKPNLDKVIFQFTTDTAAAFQAFKSDQVSVLYPQPQLDAIDQIKAGLPNAQSSYSPRSGNVEALWINNEAFPFDSLAVRQAVGFSIDRDAVVKRLFGAVGVDKAVQSFNPPIVSAFAGEDFSKYTLNLDKVNELMTGDGWAKGSDGVWAKDGKKAEFAFSTTANNKRRELTQEVVQSQLKDAGFLTVIERKPAGELFGQILPDGKYAMALYAQVATFPSPSLSSIFLSTNIPTEANAFSGQNWTRTNVDGLDKLLKQVDTELDEAKRIEVSKEADKLIAESATSLPLDPLPNILLWSNSVLGPVSDNPVEGPFWNLSAWGLKQ
jgi:peptide/nickel transport system substrate-binding protein